MKAEGRRNSSFIPCLHFRENLLYSDCTPVFVHGSVRFTGEARRMTQQTIQRDRQNVRHSGQFGKPIQRLPLCAPCAGQALCFRSAEAPR